MQKACTPSIDLTCEAHPVRCKLNLQRFNLASSNAGQRTHIHLKNALNSVIKADTVAQLLNLRRTYI